MLKPKALRDIPREEGPLALSRRVCRKRIPE
jgi:hypothetical protein